MNMKAKLGGAAMLVALLSVLCLGLGSGVASASTLQLASVNLPKLPHNARSAALPNTSYTSCTFQTPLGYYLTAVGGGGRTTDVIHTDARRVGSWERLNLYYQGYSNVYAIQTSVTFNYLTAVGGGGRTTDVIHSDAIRPQSWERFNLVLLGVRNDGVGLFALQTVDGHYLTAVGEGGRQTDTIHSDATRIQAWEEFYVSCNPSSPFGS
jgi:hypothetical protein